MHVTEVLVETAGTPVKLALTIRKSPADTLIGNGKVKTIPLLADRSLFDLVGVTAVVD